MGIVAIKTQVPPNMISPSVFTLIILPVAIIAAALFVSEFIKRRRMENRIQNRLPNANRVGKLDDSHLLELRRTLGEHIAQDMARLPPHEMELTQHALWQAMLLEAGADDDIDAAEADFVTKLYGEIVSNEPNRSLVHEESERIMKSRAASLSEIAKATGVSMRSKFNVLQGAFLVSVTNKVLEPTEARWLKEIADALALTPEERTLMFDELSDILDFKVARREFLFWEEPGKGKR